MKALEKKCLTDGGVTLYAHLNDTEAARDFEKRLPCTFSGSDSGIDYCCTAAKGRYGPTETQIGWKTATFVFATDGLPFSTAEKSARNVLAALWSLENWRSNLSLMCATCRKE